MEIRTLEKMKNIRNDWNSKHWQAEVIAFMREIARLIQAITLCAWIF